MSPTARLASAIFDTVVGYLAPLFLAGAGGDVTAARQAASHALAAYHVETEEELRLAAEVISFRLQALDALGQAASPDAPLSIILRLRGSAVSLGRQSHKAQRRLDQLRTVRPASTPAQPAAVRTEPPYMEAGQMEATQPKAPPTTMPHTQPHAQPAATPSIQSASTQPAGTQPTGTPIEQAAALIDFARDVMQSAGKNGGKTWTQSYQQRRMAQRIAENLSIAENLRKNQATPAPPAARRSIPGQP